MSAARAAGSPMPSATTDGGAGLLGAELLAEHVVHLAAARRPRAAPGRRGATRSMRRNGAPRKSSTAMAARGDDDRPAHHEDGHPVPEARRRGASVDRLKMRELVHVAAEGGEDGGQHDDREQAGQEGHGHAGVGEAAQEGEREHEQRAQRGGHGHRAEGHGAAGGAHGALHGDVGLVAGAQLLPDSGTRRRASSRWPGRGPWRW